MNSTSLMKAFIIDDDVFMANILQKYLQDAGYQEISLFESGLEALHRLYEQPNIILLDIEMDQLNGFEVLKKIKRFNPNLYVVMVSGQNNMKIALDTLRYGALDYLVKDDTMKEELNKTLKKIEAIEVELKKGQPSLLKKIIKSIV